MEQKKHKTAPPYASQDETDEAGRRKGDDDIARRQMTPRKDRSATRLDTNEAARRHDTRRDGKRDEEQDGERDAA